MTTDEDLYEVTTSLDEPFYDGTRVEASSGTALPIGIDGRGFMWDDSPNLSIYHRYQRTPINLLNTQQSKGNDDTAQTPPEIWRRVVESWITGAGQSNMDRPDSVQNRYYRSRNIDPFDPWKIRLIHGTEQLQTLGAGRSFLSRVSPGLLFVGNGTDGWFYSDLDTVPVHVTMTDPILDVTSDGETLYVLDSAGNIEAWTDASTHSSFASGVAVVAGRMLLRFMKGFLVVATGQDLYDVSTGTATLIYSHPLSGWTWVDGTEGFDAAFLVGGMGDRWHVASMAIKNDSTTFDVPILNAGPIPDGEIAYAIGFYLNYLVVGLSTGWRFGAPDGNGNVQLGRLVTTAGPVRCFEGQDRFIWYGTTDVDETGLGRADLSTFSGPLTPAACSDLRADTAGTVRAVTTFQGKRVFTIDGVGLYAETDDLATDGWLEQGNMNFGTSDRKVGSYVQVYMEPLVGSLLVETSLDGRDYTTLTTVGSAGSVSIGKAPLEQTFDTVDVKFTLTRSATDPTLGPTVTRLEVRATPIAGNASEWQIPLLLSNQLDVRTATLGRTTESDFDFLMSLVQSKRYFTLREGLRTRTAHATDYAWLPDKLNPSGSWFTGVFVLVCREIS